MMDEEQSKAEGRGEMSETELLIMDQFTILVRDLYAFYPLLIRFVDYNRYSHIHRSAAATIDNLQQVEINSFAQKWSGDFPYKHGKV